MSYSIDANILLYASDAGSEQQRNAVHFLNERKNDTDLMCITWLTLMSYQRIATHPGIFKKPLTPKEAWQNINSLLHLPLVRVIGEEKNFASDYLEMTSLFPVRGNLVPDAHLATVLRQHGVTTLYSADTDFRKFEFLKVINPLK